MTPASDDSASAVVPDVGPTCARSAWHTLWQERTRHGSLNMTGSRPGWHPHNPQLSAGGQHPSWQDLADTWPRSRATSFRRFWNGCRWDGSHIANTDLLAVTVCPGCERHTGFIALAIDEEKDYMVGSFESGSIMLSNPRKIPKRLLRAWQSKESIKCIDCGTHVTQCPSCKEYNFAGVGFRNCIHCGEEFL
jgi:hypothetical protein